MTGPPIDGPQVASASASVSAFEIDEPLRRILAEVVETIDLELLLFDPGTLRIRWASRAVRERLGYTAAQLAALQIGDLAPEPPASAWRDETEANLLETVLVARDGRRWPRDLTRRRLRRDEGVVGVVVATDAVERRAADRALRRRTAELAASIRDFEQFSAVASHDMRAPLNQVCAYLDLVLEDHGAALPEEARGHLRTVAARVRRVQDLVTILLEYSDVSVTTPQFGVVSLEALTSEAVEMAGDFGAVGGTVEIGSLPEVNADAALIRKVLVSALRHALEARSAARALRVRVEALETRGTWRIVIADNGRGMSEAEAAAAFDIFPRPVAAAEADGCAAPHAGSDGSGPVALPPGAVSGLAICRRGMELHGGQAWFERHETEDRALILEFPKGRVDDVGPFG